MPGTTNLCRTRDPDLINAAADVVHFKNVDRLTGERVATEAAFVSINGITGLIDAWDVTADLAATKGTGNTETSDLNFVASATYTGEHWRAFRPRSRRCLAPRRVADVATSEQLTGTSIRRPRSSWPRTSST